MRAQLPCLKSITLGEGRSRETCDLESIWRADYDNVAQAAEELPSVISWLNYHFAEAKERALRAERLYKEAESTMYFELRNGAYITHGYGDKMTEKSLEMAVRSEPQVQDAAVEYEKAVSLAERIRGQISAIQAKLDLIRTSEATRRRIHEGPVSDEEVSRIRDEDVR